MSFKALKYVRIFEIVQTCFFMSWAVLGVILPLGSMIVYDNMMAAYFFIVGMVSIYFGLNFKEDESFRQFGLSRGLIYIVMALIVFFFLRNIPPLFAIVLGVFIICVASSKIFYIHQVSKKKNLSITNLICLVIGIFLMFDPGTTDVFIIRTFSAALFLMGSSNVVDLVKK